MRLESHLEWNFRTSSQHKLYLRYTSHLQLTATSMTSLSEYWFATHGLQLLGRRRLGSTKSRSKAMINRYRDFETSGSVSDSWVQELYPGCDRSVATASLKRDSRVYLPNVSCELHKIHWSLRIVYRSDVAAFGACFPKNMSHTTLASIHEQQKNYQSCRTCERMQTLTFRSILVVPTPDKVSILIEYKNWLQEDVLSAFFRDEI